MYTEKKRAQVEKMMGLSEIYFPMFEETFDKHNLPLEFKYLALVESALNTHAVSRAGATGLWQFMYRTGKMYKLDINSYVDERRDPVKSTEAAAGYFMDMYEIYGDWLLVIAAYNCGPGNVNKAIRRSGGKTTFWEIRPYLPRETRGYVPAFMAAVYMMEYHQEHNFNALHIDFNTNMVDTVHVRKQTTFQNIEKYTGTSMDQIKFLNPKYKRNIIPASTQSQVIYLPMNKVAMYDTYKDSIFKKAAKKTVVAAKPVKYAPKTSSKSTTRVNSYSSTKGKTKLFYTVKSGDNLGYIAEWYDCRAQDIRNWNGMYGSNIRVGNKLKIYVSNSKANTYKKVENLSFKQKESIEAKQKNKNTSTKTASSSSRNAKDGSKYTYYKVKSGDTLWDIARKYPNTSVDEIKRLNRISNTKRIKPGMVIRIENQ